MTYFTQTATSNIDSYKLGHPDQFPDGTNKVYANFTPRSLRLLGTPQSYSDNLIAWVGFQVFLKDLKRVWQETFFDLPKDVAVSEFAELAAPFCGPRGFNTERLEWLHDVGYLPLEIKALPEGTLVPVGIPVLTITNTLPKAYWLPSNIETWLSSDCWKTPTVATIAYNYRKIIDYYTNVTGGNKDFVQWQGHDFSSRGMSGMIDAGKTGIGHLCFFTGTDNVTAVHTINSAYDGKNTFVGGSVPATEHATMTSRILVEVKKLEEVYYGQNIDKSEDELFAEAETIVIEQLITEIYPSGVVSIVSDSFDFWTVITKIAPALKDKILNRIPDSFGLAKVVFRPDSGDPVKILCGHSFATVTSIESYAEMIDVDAGGYNVVFNEEDGKYYTFESYDNGWSTEFTFNEISEAEVKGAVECLWDIFGGTTNDRGFRTLNQRVGLIYGDSITMARCEDILRQLAAKGFASDNVVFGIGSYTYQYLTRDTCGFAMKATYVEVDGEPISIFKNPKTDSGTKKSAKGLLQVVEENGTLVLKQDVTWEEEKQGLLRTVFLDGEILIDEDFATVRNRIGVIKS